MNPLQKILAPLNSQKSLTTKIILVVLGLLILVVGSLQVTTLVLLKKDKALASYQNQSLEAQAAGKELYYQIESSVAELKTGMGLVPSNFEISPTAENALTTWFKNQTRFTQATFYHLPAGATDVAGSAVFAVEKPAPDSDAVAKIPSPESVTSFESIRVFPNGPMSVKLMLSFESLAAVATVSLKQLAPEGALSRLSFGFENGAEIFDTQGAKNFLKADPLFQKVAALKLNSGVTEFEGANADQNEKKMLGSFYKPGLGLLVLSRVELSLAMKGTYLLLERFLYLALMAAGFAILFSVLFARTVTAPVNALFEATKEVSAGNFDLKIRPQSNDEIGVLTESFNLMSDKIVELIEQTRTQASEAARVESEIEIASTVQKTLLPEPAYSDELYDVYGHYQAASECGGDWWGFFRQGSKLCILIGDATGHGIPSALITASARSCFSVMQKLGEDAGGMNMSPGQMLSFANRVVYDSAQGQIMMTFFAAVLDSAAGTLTYASAGHNPPWLFKKTGSGFALSSLTVVGPRLGESKDAPVFAEKQVKLDAGDMLFLYTDGLTEGTNEANEQYSKKRARSLVTAHVHEGPEALVRHVVADFMSHNGEKHLADDLTLAVVKVKGGDHA